MKWNLKTTKLEQNLSEARLMHKWFNRRTSFHISHKRFIIKRKTSNQIIVSISLPPCLLNVLDAFPKLQISRLWWLIDNFFNYFQLGYFTLIKPMPAFRVPSQTRRHCYGWVCNSASIFHIFQRSSTIALVKCFVMSIKDELRCGFRLVKLLKFF